MATTETMMSTPVNTISRENLKVLVRNNILNESLEFSSDTDVSMMETDSPIRKTCHNLAPISKKLFHSPLPDLSPRNSKKSETKINKHKRGKKRKYRLIPDSAEKVKRAYVKELERDECSPNVSGGMRKKVLISLFHNKEYSMDFS